MTDTTTPQAMTPEDPEEFLQSCIEGEYHAEAWENQMRKYAQLFHTSERERELAEAGDQLPTPRAVAFEYYIDRDRLLDEELKRAEHFEEGARCMGQNATSLLAAKDREIYLLTLQRDRYLKERNDARALYEEQDEKIKGMFTAEEVREKEIKAFSKGFSECNELTEFTREEVFKDETYGNHVFRKLIEKNFSDLNKKGEKE